MRDDVIDGRGLGVTTGHGADGVRREVFEAGLAPLMVIATLAGRRAPSIMTGAAQAIGLTLATAEDAMRDAVAAGADAGRAAHWRRP